MNHGLKGLKDEAGYFKHTFLFTVVPMLFEMLPWDETKTVSGDRLDPYPYPYPSFPATDIPCRGR